MPTPCLGVAQSSSIPETTLSISACSHRSLQLRLWASVLSLCLFGAFISKIHPGIMTSLFDAISVYEMLHRNALLSDRRRNLNILCWNIIYSAIKKEGSIDSCNSMDKPWKRYVIWKRQDTKGHKLYDCAYIKYPQQTNSYREKADSDCQRLGEGGNAEWVEGFLLGWWNVLKLDGGGCTILWIP